MTNLPPEQDIPAAWYGPDMMVRQSEWLHELEPSEVAEVEEAAQDYLDRGYDIAEIGKNNFVLPTMASQLEVLRHSLQRGVGFGVLRGLPVARYSRELTATIFCGIGAHLGFARSQNGDGHLLGHVRDVGLSTTDMSVRIYQTSERQSFHTDSCDVVGLLCLKTAAEGGESMLVSAATIFNEIRRNRPDLAPLLFEPVATDRRGEVPDGQKPYFEIPVLSWHEGYLTPLYQRNYVDSAQRFDDAPRLSPEHIEALDLFDELANDPRLHLKMDLRPGDMQFVYNHALLHDRLGFRDHEDPAERRHLLRLWLACPGDRPLPDSFRQRYGDITIGDRGGILVKGTQLHVPLD